MAAPAEQFGEALPLLFTEVPGPRSLALAQRLARVESRNITRLEPTAPIFWEEASGANVRDVDGNVYIDLTAGFGVATAGHAHPAVTTAISNQASRLAHGLGDVHPSRVKVELLEKLAELTPGKLEVSILGSSGAEAVEAALKTALLRTLRPGIVAFERSYHGLTYGALAVTHRRDFRGPFQSQLNDRVRFAPFAVETAELSYALARLDSMLDDTIGAIIVEPIQGRGGLRLPAPGFLAALRERCDGRRRVLIFDEIYTGMGRTGGWFACEHWRVVPDILVIGKGLTGSVPLSAAVGTADVMSAWPPSTGEAIHTSTFLGNPIACAAALAQIAAIEGLLERATAIGRAIQEQAASWLRHGFIREPAFGLAALQGIPFRTGSPTALAVSEALLQNGVLALAEGDQAEILALTPPLAITDRQLAYVFGAIRRILAD